MRWAELDNQRVAIWGAGREGRAAYRALRRHAPTAKPTVLCRPDERDEVNTYVDAQTPVLAQVVTADTLRAFDVVVKSPGISPHLGAARDALAAGVRFVSGSALWFANHPDARVIAVSGTKGKSTTTAMIAHLLRAAGRRVVMAGNIGLPLLDVTSDPSGVDWYVLELSSFQTRDMDAIPEIVVLLNLYPEHLDWHGGLEPYYTDKLALLGDLERAPRVAVLNAASAELVQRARAPRIAWFGRSDGFDVRDEAIWRGTQRILPVSDLPLPGLHNALNACAALATVAEAGENAAALAASLAAFRPLPHRLQTLGERDGYTWVDDSIATTPYATLAALLHFCDRAPTTVLVGGFDRGVSWEAFRDALPDIPLNAVVTMGGNGRRIAATLLESTERRYVLRECGDLADAVATAREITPAGGVVLLSPGAPSFGEFRDYMARGQRFAELAGFDAALFSTIEGLGP
jgi:UDP-N-acetylmuramoylalanine--D-glutamate ligase